MGDSRTVKSWTPAGRRHLQEEADAHNSGWAMKELIEKIRGDKTLSKRSIEELQASSSYKLYNKGANQRTEVSAYNNEEYKKLSELYAKAQESIASGTGSEFSRVLREKYVKQAADTPGRRQTIATGRL